MNKDVIYIDAEDDITAIISKVKSSNERIVALVPPKQVGVLQSAVNLRILARVAKTVDKHLVLITSNSALLPLAAAAELPVAKNLQTKPVVPELPATKPDDDDDIIDGANLPIADHAATVPESRRPAPAPAHRSPLQSTAPPATRGTTPSPEAAQTAKKVPNFNDFRKKLFIGGGIGVLLLAIILWATFIAPHATIEIAAKTSDERLQTSVSLTTTGRTDIDSGTLRATVAEDKRDTSIDFTATGQREEGDKAGGTITLSTTTPDSVEVPVGTGFSNGNCTFTTTSAVRVPGVSPEWDGNGFGISPGKADVTVKATQIGEECNLSARSYESTIDKLKATGSAMQGGSKKQVTFVTQNDVQRAAEQLAEQKNESQKNILSRKLGQGVQPILESYQAIKTNPSPSPAVGQEAKDGKAKLSASVTYRMYGVQVSELDSFISSATLAKRSSESGQKVYQSGAKNVVFSDFSTDDNHSTVSLLAVAKVGPEIKDSDVKRRAMGKKYSDINNDLSAIHGVDSVDIRYSLPWISTVPNDAKKITVKFSISNNGQ